MYAPSVLDDCVECYTEDVGSDCTNTCTLPLEGILDENLIDYAVDVSKEACASECKALLGMPHHRFPVH